VKDNFLHFVTVGVTVTGHKESEGANDTKDFFGEEMGPSLPHSEENKSEVTISRRCVSTCCQTMEGILNLSIFFSDIKFG
jgi:hypothetical protein